MIFRCVHVSLYEGLSISMSVHRLVHPLVSTLVGPSVSVRLPVCNTFLKKLHKLSQNVIESL